MCGRLADWKGNPGPRRAEDDQNAYSLCLCNECRATAHDEAVAEDARIEALGWDEEHENAIAEGRLWREAREWTARKIDDAHDEALVEYWLWFSPRSAMWINCHHHEALDLDALSPADREIELAHDEACCADVVETEHSQALAMTPMDSLHEDASTEDRAREWTARKIDAAHDEALWLNPGPVSCHSCGRPADGEVSIVGGRSLLMGVCEACRTAGRTTTP